MSRKRGDKAGKPILLHRNIVLALLLLPAAMCWLLLLV